MRRLLAIALVFGLLLPQSAVALQPNPERSASFFGNGPESQEAAGKRVFAIGAMVIGSAVVLTIAGTMIVEVMRQKSSQNAQAESGS